MGAVTGDEGKPCGDPLSEFETELNALIRRWSERTGGRCDMALRQTFIQESPVDGFRQERTGPRAEIALTITDMSRLDELLDAYYPVRDAAELIRERGDDIKGRQGRQNEAGDEVRAQSAVRIHSCLSD